MHKVTSVQGINNEVISSYKYGQIVELTQNDMKINYEYNVDDDTTIVRVGDDNAYCTTKVNGDNTYTTLISQENISNIYNDAEKTSKIMYSRNAESPEQNISTIKYDKYNQIKSRIDKTYNLVYNENNRYNKYGDLEYSEVGKSKLLNRYDNHGHLIGQNVEVFEKTYAIDYKYDELYDRISGATSWGAKQNIEYDKLGRVINVDTDSLSRRKSYLQKGDHTTDIQNELEQSIGGVIVDKKRYIYDKVGNIERIYSNGVEKVHYIQYL